MSNTNFLNRVIKNDSSKFKFLLSYYKSYFDLKSELVQKHTVTCQKIDFTTFILQKSCLFILSAISLYTLFVLVVIFKTSLFLWILMMKFFETFKCEICFLLSRPSKNMKKCFSLKMAKWMGIDILTFMLPSTSVFKNSLYFIV